VVRDLIRAAAPGPVVLVGTSFGAHIAAAIAADDENVEGLILLAPVIITDGFTLPGPDDPPPTLLAHPDRVHLDPIAPEHRERQLKIAHRYFGSDLTDVVRGLSGPTLVAFGTIDEAVPPKLGRRYVELNPGIFLVFFYDSGHLIEFDRPEALANTIVNFAKYKRDFHLVRQSGLLFP
jgi:pimeloyl-ACP methyl ester carboxylesterase